MEIKYLRLIKTIAEEGSIVNSSEKLFLTQSALSHQLIVLEERLGFKVFHRSRQKWKLTEEGEELYKLANDVLQSIERGMNKIKFIKEGSKGIVKLSTECYSLYDGLPGFIQKMGVLYPDIKLDLIDATHQPISKLLSNEIDAALVTAKPSSESLLSIPLFEDEIFGVMHKEHALSSKAFLEPHDFLDVHLLIHSFPLETVSVYAHYLKPHKINPIRISAIPLTEISLEMVHANMGMLCEPKWTLRSFKMSDDILYKKIGPSGLKRTCYLVVRTADRDKKYMDDFVNSFEEDFGVK